MKLLSQFLCSFLIVFGVTLGVINNAYADYTKEPVQEFLDTDQRNSDFSLGGDLDIDSTPQIPPPDIDDVMDANDAEVTTPITAFVFWALMGAFCVGFCAYILARFGGFGKQRA